MTSETVFVRFKAYFFPFVDHIQFIHNHILQDLYPINCATCN